MKRCAPRVAEELEFCIKPGGDAGGSGSLGPGRYSPVGLTFQLVKRRVVADS